MIKVITEKKGTVKPVVISSDGGTTIYEEATDAITTTSYYFLAVLRMLHYLRIRS